VATVKVMLDNNTFEGNSIEEANWNLGCALVGQGVFVGIEGRT
jgi:hypothetical protein